MAVGLYFCAPVAVVLQAAWTGLLAPMFGMSAPGFDISRRHQRNRIQINPLVPGGMILTSLFVIALAEYELRTHGLVHPVTVWAGGALLLLLPLRLVLARTEAWETVGRAVLT